MLAYLGLEQAELSVLLTDDAGIHRLNLIHRGTDRPTDVLAFPLDAESFRTKQQKMPVARSEQAVLLGDVVISVDTAARQGKSHHRDLMAEVRFLLAHGLLHLLGYDHDNLPKKKEMDRMTATLVRACG